MISADCLIVTMLLILISRRSWQYSGKSILKVLNQTERMSLEDGAGVETEYFGALFGGEGTEGMKAFLEKRDPSW